MKTYMLLDIFLEAMIHIFQESLMNKVQKNSIYLKSFVIVLIFAVTFEHLNASLLNNNHMYMIYLHQDTYIYKNIISCN